MAVKLRPELERGDVTARSPRINMIAPNQAASEATLSPRATTWNFSFSFFSVFFALHMILISILNVFLFIRSFNGRSKFHPVHWYPPLITSAAAALGIGALWLLATLYSPAKALRAAFWVAPSLTVVAAVLLLSIESAGGLAAGAAALLFGIVQSLYACWVTPRRSHAARLLSAATALGGTGRGIAQWVSLALLAALTYSCMWTMGVGGATASGGRVAALLVFVLLLSLAWTTQVVRVAVHVAVARVAYLQFSQSHAYDAGSAFVDACTVSAGTVCFGSCLVPVVGLVRGVARALNLVAEDKDEVLFSCTDCCTSVADRLIRYANWWGLVQVGSNPGKGLVQASSNTWELFEQAGLVRFVDTDLTGSSCFLTGIASGSLCTIIAGSWALAVDKSFATNISLYAFLIGYFMSRIAMDWPQACVSAYIVAYAENPQNPRFDATITERVRRLRPTTDVVYSV